MSDKRLRLGREFYLHRVFGKLRLLKEFYLQLGDSVFGFAQGGTVAVLNADSYVFSSMAGTLNSIRLVAYDGQVSDAYTLLRKYHDLSVLNLYIALLLSKHNASIIPIIPALDAWMRGKHKFPRFAVMMQKIALATDTRAITELLDLSEGGQFERIRERCNDHTHYNFFRYALINDASVELNPKFHVSSVKYPRQERGYSVFWGCGVMSTR